MVYNVDPGYKMNRRNILCMCVCVRFKQKCYWTFLRYLVYSSRLTRPTHVSSKKFNPRDKIIKWEQDKSNIPWNVFKCQQWMNNGKSNSKQWYNKIVCESTHFSYSYNNKWINLLWSEIIASDSHQASQWFILNSYSWICFHMITFILQIITDWMALHVVFLQRKCVWFVQELWAPLQDRLIS